MGEQINFELLAKRLIRDSSRATAARQYFSTPGIRKWLSSTLSAPPGSEHSFLADPLFEATFGWEPSGLKWQDLDGNLLGSSTINALDYKGSQHKIERDWSVYSHQLEAIKVLGREEPASLVVSSGTGSGKTECFLVPILDHLARQVEAQTQPLVGVQALFLYPLNALINSQRERLSAWMSPFEGRIRYCLYNGDTPPEARELIPEQVLSRRALRDAPPPLLLTNSTMLEYMLLRSQDTPILEKSQGCLRWIVLDEAHTYIGSQAAEVALLLRRVMLAFGVKPGDVRFIATSATIGDGGSESRDRLREFLADLAGVSREQVVVVMGQREIPELVSGSDQTPLKLSDDLTGYRGKSSNELYDLFCRSPLAKAVRSQLVDGPSTVGQIEVATVEEHGKRSMWDWLSLMSLLSQASNSNGDAFLPMRMHLYHRTMAGLWACINKNCVGKNEFLKEEGSWKWGATFTDKTDICMHCNSLVLEVVRCSECGSDHLACDELYDGDSGETTLLPRLPAAKVDDFSLDVEIDTWEGSGASDADLDDHGEPEEDVDVENHPFGRQRRYLLSRSVKRENAKSQIIESKVSLAGKFDTAGESVQLLMENEDGNFVCAVCNESETRLRREEFLFRSSRAGMPFYSLLAARNVLNESPPLLSVTSKKQDLPFDGKRVITFSDSRQGTARLSMSQYQDADRNFVRSQIYHRLVEKGLSSDVDQQIAKLTEEVSELESLGSDKSAILSMLEEKRKQLESLAAGADRFSMSWSDMCNSLAMSKTLTTQSKIAWSEIALGSSITEVDYARFCMYREFIRRSKRGNTLETLGLVAIQFPRIETVGSVPPEAQERGVSLDEWRTILHLSVSFIFRARYAIDINPDWSRWLGDKVFPTTILSPSPERVKNRIQWPTASSRRSTIVKLIVKAYLLDLETELDRQWLDLVLISIWDQLNGFPNSFISNTGDGFQLNLSQHAELIIPETVWQCPFTGKAFDKVLRGISPYSPSDLNDAEHLCTEVKMPQLPAAFWIPSTSSDEVFEPEDWLEENPVVNEARSVLMWENHSDMIAKNSKWYSAGEHSAQQKSSQLKRLESSFKAGRTNILNCSTTMEMGVDIGGISAVMMNNAPPGPANYLQRAGRAGRRGESAAAALTICSSSAHGAMLFHNPTWPFDALIAVPRVSLQSTDIVQRHVNAFLLSSFIKPLDSDLNTTCGWFFDRVNDEDSVYDAFTAYLEELIVSSDLLAPKLFELTKRSILAPRPPESLAAATLEKIKTVADEWSNIVDSMRSDLAVLESSMRNAEKSPAYKAVSFRMKRVIEEYLFRELANVGFLPGYGFPTDVVSFVTDTIDDLNAKKKSDNREDNRSNSRGYPSRGLAVAMREYAPGAEIALNGRIYKSGGVLLNWHLPPGPGSTSEVQALRNYWYCKKCGAGDTTIQFAPQHCMYCGSENVSSKKFLEPSGFAVDLMYHPHNDSSQMTFMPVVPPRLNINSGTWISMANRKAGRLRYSPNGAILHRNPGANRFGYSICLRCGRTEEQTAEGKIATIFEKPHYRLRGGKDTSGQSICEASHEEYSIATDHELAHQSYTSITEVQFNNPDTGAPLKDEKVAWSLAVAMRYGLVQTLGLEESEVGISVQETRPENGELVYSIYFYDHTSGGAGYSETVLHELSEIVSKATQLLECSNQCENACHSCLISYDTQHKIDLLDRKIALEFVNRGLPGLLALPEECRYFGDSSRNVALTFGEALSSSFGRAETTGIDIFLSGEAEQWELQEWGFIQTLVKYSTSGLRVRLAILKSVVDSLPDHQLRFLHAVSQLRGFDLFEFNKFQPLKKNGKLLAIVNSGDTRRAWASHKDASLVPGENWIFNLGTLVTGVISADYFDSITQPLAENALEGGAEVKPGGSRMTIYDELNGPVNSFGSKFWSTVYAHAPNLEEQFRTFGEAEKIVYTDKFIKSPLAVRLLSEVVLGLPSELFGSKTQFNIHTVEIKQDRDRKFTPRNVDHDWNVDIQRRAVTASLLQQMGWAYGATDVRELNRVPHYRELQINWPGDNRWTVQFDHGFGCWTPVMFESFPFQQSVANQGTAAATMNPKLKTRNENFKNYIFIDNQVGSK